jgi:hypothetical protein
VSGEEKNILYWALEQPRQDKNLLYWQDELEKPTKVFPGSPFVFVSTVGRDHPSPVSLVVTGF